MGLFGKSKENSRRVVLEGIFGGFLVLAILFVLLAMYLPSYNFCPSVVGPRMVFALKLMIFPALLLFINFFAVAIARINPDLMNPLKAKENDTFRINRNVLQNSLEQFVLFFVTMMVYSIVFDGSDLKLVMIAVIIYCIGRLLFWVGYHKDILYRAPGMVLTGVYFPILFYDAYRVFFSCCLSCSTCVAN